MKNVPKLRFKDDNGRDFPAWEKKRLVDISTRVKRKNTENNKNVLTISAQQGLINQEEFFNKSVSAKDVTNYYLLHRGEFAYNKSYSNGYPMGAIKCLNRYEKGVVSTLYICFELKNNNVNAFFEHYFESGKHNNEIEKVAQEGARNHGLLNIGLDDFFNILLLIPSLPEQTKIADFLTAIDDRISQLSQKCDGLAQYKKGVMQKIFSQELRFKDEKGRAFPAWDAMELNRIGSTFNGLTGKSGDDFGDGESYITYKQIFSDRIVDIAKFSKVKVNEGEKQNKVKYGDIFFTISSETPEEVGFHSVLLSEIENVYLNSFCFGFRINSFDVVIPIFAYYMFGSAEFRREVIKLAQGSTRYNISKTAFMEIKVKMPSPPEQEKIAGFLSAVDEKISQAQSQLDALKQYKQGLLQQMFV